MHVDKSYLVREDQATAGPSVGQNHRDGVRAKDISPIGTRDSSKRINYFTGGLTQA